VKTARVNARGTAVCVCEHSSSVTTELTAKIAALVPAGVTALVTTVLKQY